MISLCTPTRDRRPFIPYMIKCIENQTHPKDNIEWIIIDDGDDKIEDLVKDITYVRYYKTNKMNVGEKRNLMNRYAKGEILIYIDDDDYYPPERISHVVESLNTDICGSSIMYMYFTDLDEIYKFGPYGENHATAATFGFKRELLNKSAFNDNDTRGEERFFLKRWSIPLTQMDPKKTILVIAHNMNTVDKTFLLHGFDVKPTNYMLEDFIKDKETIQFYRNIQPALNKYKIYLNNLA